MKLQCITSSLLRQEIPRWVPLWLLMGLLFVGSSCMPTVTINDSQTPPPYELTLKVPPTPTPYQSKRYNTSLRTSEVFVQARLESGWVVYAFATFIRDNFLITLKNPRYERLAKRIRFGENDPFTTLDVHVLKAFQHDPYQLLHIHQSWYFMPRIIQSRIKRCTTCIPFQPHEKAILASASGEEHSYFIEMEIVDNHFLSDYISVKETPAARERAVLGKALLQYPDGGLLGLYLFTKNGTMHFSKMDCMEFIM